MTSPGDIMLYWGDGSPPCMAVLIVLEEKNLQGYQQKCLSFDREEYRNPEVVELNPRAELPTCKIGDIVLNESLAICKYLDQKNPTKGVKLTLDDVEANALMWQRLCEFYWNFPRKCYINYVKYLWKTPYAERTAQDLKRLREDFIKELRIWDAYFKDRQKDGAYVMGSCFTLADAVIFPWIAYLPALEMDYQAAKLPHLDHYYKTLKKRPSIEKMFPKFWDGSVDTTVLKDIHTFM